MTAAKGTKNDKILPRRIDGPLNDYHALGIRAVVVHRPSAILTANRGINIFHPTIDLSRDLRLSARPRRIYILNRPPPVMPLPAIMVRSILPINGPGLKGLSSVHFVADQHTNEPTTAPSAFPAIA
jgi:hypothetical protein